MMGLSNGSLGVDRDKSDGLSRAEIRCGFHSIQAEAKRRKEAVARRKRKETLRKEAREKEARKAEAERYEEGAIDLSNSGQSWDGPGKNGKRRGVACSCPCQTAGRAGRAAPELSAALDALEDTASASKKHA